MVPPELWRRPATNSFRPRLTARSAAEFSRTQLPIETIPRDRPTAGDTMRMPTAGVTMRTQARGPAPRRGDDDRRPPLPAPADDPTVRLEVVAGRTAPSQVFVDDSGRRRRWVRVASTAATAVCLAYVGLVATTWCRRGRDRSSPCRRPATVLITASRQRRRRTRLSPGARLAATRRAQLLAADRLPGRVTADDPEGGVGRATGRGAAARHPPRRGVTCRAS